ncbi:MarR family transcriptional regulator [Paenibacillus psychroresistens]|uniref:MarR family transcriptional regulator n=1 Tax=Paenibacillus psychroresistens TaxID=1778678 RepID=A0A6B8RTE4_9BACL|nr:MarR family transcriptional regulator [Paenibacillus psychroresistens]QGQ99157.1 MarR family transcriptional regulator [Paenibacillus psychroresistens]
MDDQEKKLFYIKLQKLINQFEAYEEVEKKRMLPLAALWGISNVNRSLTISEIHLVEQIGLLERANVTRLAEKLKLTKGAITKISTKLLARGWIEKLTIEGNLKEVFYQLTDQGNLVHHAYIQYHERAENQFQQFIQKYTDNELQFIERLIGDLTEVIDYSMNLDGMK